MSLVELLGPGELAISDRAQEIGRDLVRAALEYALFEDAQKRADEACASIRARVPPGVMPPPGVQRELESALATSRRAFELVKRQDNAWKALARTLVEEMRKASK
jgi:hypothetical protein